jgi:3-hydroxy-9,10-secoandrosta-1,3,5(10)-triene-9,17-dione monooxygenase reductase component
MEHPQLKFLAEFDTMRSGVYIATSSFENHPAGCTCVWVTRASFDPPLIAVNMSPVRHTFHTIEKSGMFCLNVMGASGLEQARFFGFHSGHLEDKFRAVDYRNSPGGCPLLGLAVAYLDCRLHSIVSAGDHRLVIGEVTAAAIVGPEAPLVYNPNQFYQQQSDRVEAAHG